MSGYLATVIAQARGAASQVRPRIRSRFEAERGDETPPTELDGEGFAAPQSVTPPSHAAAPSPQRAMTTDSAALRPAPAALPFTAPHAQGVGPVILSKPARPPAAITPNVSGAPPIAAAGQRMERTERVERIERTTVVIPSPPPDGRAPAPASARAGQREPPPVPGVQVVAQPLPPPVPAPPPSPPAVPAIVAPVAIAPPMRRSAPTPAVPEVTISIGVLDIRLTREPEPPRRAAAPPRTTAEPPLPLADYLARRSGSGA